MISGVRRLYTGVFECDECGTRYKAIDATSEDLFCGECGNDLQQCEEKADLDEDAKETDEAS
jgi:transcription initiation factor IIE alpha subunit